MAALGTFRGLQFITPDPGQAGGLAVSNNFIEIAKRAGPITTKAFDPLITDDDVGTAGNGTFFQFSKWWNSATKTMFILGDATTGAAVWKKVGDGLDQAVVQARRSTTLALTSSFADVEFDETNKETDDGILKHNDINTDDFDNTSGETREVKATYQFVAEVSGTEVFSVQLRVNDTDPPVPGSLLSVGSAIHNQDHEISVNKAVFVTLTTGQKLTLQMDGDAAPNVVIKAGMTLLVETVD